MARGLALRAARALTPRSGPSPTCRSRAVYVYGGRRLIHNSSTRPHEALGTAAKLPDAEPIPVQTPRDVVTINDIKERSKCCILHYIYAKLYMLTDYTGAKAGKLVAGPAAYSDSDMFKAPVSSPECSCRVI